MKSILTPTQRELLTRLWINTLGYYEKQLPDPVIDLYVADLADLPMEDLEKAFQIYRRDPESIYAPRPAQIRAIVVPPVDQKLRATDLAKKICGAVAHHGPDWASGMFFGGNTHFEGVKNSYHETFKAAVLEELGPLGLEVIDRSGGWKTLYDQFFATDGGNFVSQLRDHIQAVEQLSKAGRLREMPALPSPAAAGRNPSVAMESGARALQPGGCGRLTDSGVKS